jgi:hypothetical protein
MTYRGFQAAGRQAFIGSFFSTPTYGFDADEYVERLRTATAP